MELFDPQLVGGSYSTSIWSHEVSCEGTYGTREATCRAHAPFTGVSARDGAITAGPLYGAERIILRTRDLRLQDFRATVRVTAQRGGIGKIETRDGVAWSYQNIASSARSDSAGIELVWDDYELGHYQLKVNGNVVQEGTLPESETYWIAAVPYSNWGGDEGQASVAIENPRYRPIFDCDPQAGTVKVHECFAGPDTVRLSDLEGFSRFCPSLPATFSDAGLIGPSKRVYYELARDGSVRIEDDQVWEFQYLASAQELGVPSSETGTVELCEEEFTPIEDQQDLPVPAAVVSGRTIAWTSYERYDGESIGFRAQKTALMSGRAEFMSTSAFTIDEARCPYTQSTQRYPGSLPRECFSVSAFGNAFTEGEAYAPSPGVSVKLEDLEVRYSLDDDEETYSYSARWVITLASDAVRISTTGLPVAVDRESSFSSAGVTMTSSLPSTGLVVVSANVRAVTIGESEVITQEMVIPARSRVTKTLSLPTEMVGEHEVRVWPTLVTEYGSVVFDQDENTYTVTGAIPVEDDEGVEDAGFWARCWARVRAFVGGIFA